MSCSLWPACLLWGDVIRLSPQVDLLVHVNAGNDEEDSWTSSLASQHPAQPEDDGPLVLLDHLHHPEQGHGQGEADQEEGDEGQGVRYKPLGLLTGFKIS